MRLSIKSFRAFQEVTKALIAPITLLVGENSAGKTSFLALVRYVYEALSANPDVSFNKEPFFLGAFEQIAHFRGGSSGRAKNFSFCVETLVAANIRFPLKSGSDLPDEIISINVQFENRFSQPFMSHLTFEVSKNKLIVSALEGGNYEVTVKYPGGSKKVDFGKRRSFSFNTEDGGYRSALPYIMQDFYFFVLSVSERNLDNSDPFVQAVKYLTAYLNGLSMSFDVPVYSSSPVRTKPDRAYTPIDIIANSEGGHIPYQLSKLKRHQQKAWQSLRSRLNEFGKNSGIFEEIDVKNLGRSESDPFQIYFKMGGPSRNIVDVGYGVSQVLPILVEIFRSKSPALFILQQPEVHLHPQAQAALGSLLASQAKEKRFVIETHSDFILDRVRMSVRDGQLQPTDVSILYFDRSRLDTQVHSLTVDELGNVCGTPPGYREFFMRENLRSIG